MNFIKQITPKGWIIIAVVIVIIILIIYFATKKPATVTTTVTQPVVANTTTYGNGNNFPLQMGSRGDNVKKWQHYLNGKGAGLVEDGIWGKLTEAASLKYMGFNSVTQDYFNSVIK